jgi:hypothetical protein
MIANTTIAALLQRTEAARAAALAAMLADTGLVAHADAAVLTVRGSGLRGRSAGTIGHAADPALVMLRGAA